MDDATQPSTQPYTDPRRRGLNNSGLDEQEVADIVCILHPSSLSAHTAVATTAHCSPQHILQKDDLQYEATDTFSSESSRDIALRLSSEVKDLNMGFCFGRNPNRSDILLAPDDSEKKISNVHFRIYLKLDGILMLQDTSTNGTIVDNKLIRKDRKAGAPHTQMLEHGSIIHVVANDSTAGIKFIVRFPCRDGYHAQYMHNLDQYFRRVREISKKTGDGDFQNFVRAGNMRRRDPAGFIIPQTPGNSHGMHWNGGSVYNVTGQIGKGAFATVYKLATKNDGALYAAKELDKRRLMKNNVLDHKWDNEMKIMKGLRHPNIVEFRDFHDHDRWIYIIMEYVPGGELSTYLNQNNQLPEEMVKCIARQILHALQYLHRRKITHRDIKPDNILIASLDPLRVKLSDFGLSKVAQEETFLKTFCGTLLYCAPEVYPEYESYKRGEARKRRRLGDPIATTSPYDQSVDMWSLGAVLYHILCGSPPFMGRNDDRGAQMLRNIMTSEPDFDLLRKAGVSEEGIDFISRLIRREPGARMKEQECFKHQWLIDIPDEFDYMEVDGAPIEELDASLAAVNEEVRAHSEFDASDSSDEDLDGGVEKEVDGTPSENGQAKRQRLAGEMDSSHEILISLPSGQIRYPSLPNIDSFELAPSLHIERAPSGQRLFGEITESDLRSSGMIAGDLHPPLEIRGFPHQFFNDRASDSLSTSGESTTSNGSLAAAAQTPQERTSHSPSRLGTSAPSLQGAEELVGQLHMESPRTSNSPSGAEDTSAKEPSPPIKAANSNQESEDENAVQKDSVPRMHGFSRRIELSLPVSFDGRTKRAVEVGEETACSHDHSSRESAIKSVCQVATLDLATTTSDGRTDVTMQRPGKQEIPPQSILNGATRPEAKEMSHGFMEVPGAEDATTLVKPAILLGKLTTLPGSIIDSTILLESRMTSWGRGSKATIRYADPMDRRIPTYALELTFWTPSIETRITAGEDWREIPNVMTILSTKTSKCIWVNDVELKKESPSRDAYLFGKLYTDDIITVYRNRDGFLKFRCEFYHGESAQTRPTKEKGFVVQMARKTRGQAVGGETWKTIHGVTTETGTVTEADVSVGNDEEGKI